MARYASGRYAYGYSDRSGFRYRLREMRKEWNGLKVGPDEYEAKHPQLEPNYLGPDPTALYEPRPNQDTDLTSFIVYTNAGNGIIGQKMTPFTATTSLGTVTVSTT